MEAKDGGRGFDFEGTYANVVPNRLIEYILEDGRTVSINFEPVNNKIKIMETFDAEDANSAELQRQGWQSILNRFALYVESRI